MAMKLEQYVKTSLDNTETAVKKFLGDPVGFGLKFVAVILILEVMLTGVGGIFGIDSLIYTDDIIEALMFILLAWILLSNSISKFAVGIFMLIVFVTSIFFLIVPLETAIQMIKESVDPGVSMENLAPSERYLYRVFDMLQYFSGKGAVFVYALLMGALGSSIVITRQFIRDFGSMDAVWYIYRVLQGMIMALLVIYGLAAGMLSLGSKEPFIGRNFEEMKYFVGFVSALAGLFSEQAFIKLQEVSKTLFGVKSEQTKELE